MEVVPVNGPTKKDTALLTPRYFFLNTTGTVYLREVSLASDQIRIDTSQPDRRKLAPQNIVRSALTSIRISTYNSVI